MSHEHLQHTSHELLTINLIRLVENTANFVLVSFENINGTLEFVGDIQLVGVKQQDNQIGSLSTQKSRQCTLTPRHKTKG